MSFKLHAVTDGKPLLLHRFEHNGERPPDPARRECGPGQRLHRFPRVDERSASRRQPVMPSRPVVVALKATPWLPTAAGRPRGPKKPTNRSSDQELGCPARAQTACSGLVGLGSCSIDCSVAPSWRGRIASVQHTAAQILISAEPLLEPCELGGFVLRPISGALRGARQSLGVELHPNCTKRGFAHRNCAQSMNAFVNQVGNSGFSVNTSPSWFRRMPAPQRKAPIAPTLSGWMTPAAPWSSSR